MIRYNTVQKLEYAEQTIDKSRFIAYVCPVETREEAEAFISEIKIKHKDATHNVPAMVIGDKYQIQWASDDGEPQGTSGAPIVQMLVREGLTNLAVVVTRYFGGIKLGTGGLVRAYTSSVKLALQEAGICAVKDMYVAVVNLEYTYLNKLQNLSQAGEFSINQIIYEDSVQVILSAEPEKKENLKQIIANLTSGTGILREERMEQIRVPVCDFFK
ncbi:YigZ family protein [Aminipila luticellarii]|uniref:YigZ family protein n=1 Tax=Aminipila luticellarii TaxID=2507160 RepID=A0A410PW90_9FIRM|nr:YigZ family protein [Aminipila luticellarii]QAT43199.1 YigZ family protein [Aminipila luticellarii]